MDRDEFRFLYGRYRDGEIDGAEAKRLADAIRDDPDVQDLLAEDVRISGGLAVLLHSIDGEPLARSVGSRLKSGATAGEIVQRVREQLNTGEADAESAAILHRLPATRKSRKTVRRRSASRGGALSGLGIASAAAAAILIVGLIAFAFRDRTPRNIARPPEPDPKKRGVETVGENPPPTVTAGLATVRDVPVAGGIVYRMEKPYPLTAGREIQPGDRIRTAFSNSDVAAVVEYPDGTKVSLEPLTTVTFTGRENKTIRIESGGLAADVAKQPAPSPMRVVSPNATAVVLGTKLIQTVYPNATRLDVIDGSVSYENAHSAESLTIRKGQFAIAGDDIEFIPFSRDYSPKHPDRIRSVEVLSDETFATEPPSKAWKMHGSAPYRFDNGLRIDMNPDSGDWVFGNYVCEKMFDLKQPLKLTVDATWIGNDEDRLAMTFYFMKELAFDPDGQPSNYVRFQNYGAPSTADLQLTRTIPNKSKIVLDPKAMFLPGEKVTVRMIVDRTMIQIKCNDALMYYGAHSMMNLFGVYVGIGCGAKSDAKGTVLFENFKLERME